MSTYESQSIASSEITRADLELEVLKAVHARKDVKQRDIAEIVGVSLGMTNAILKRLSQKGLVTIKRVNNRNLRYAVSPDGMDAIARRSYRYFKRTIKNVVYYRDAIETLVRQASRDGYETLTLVGESDLAFILEHFCEKYGLDYRAVTEENAEAVPARNPGTADTSGAAGPDNPGATDNRAATGPAPSATFTVFGEECAGALAGGTAASGGPAGGADGPPAAPEESADGAIHLQQLLEG